MIVRRADENPCEAEPFRVLKNANGKHLKVEVGVTGSSGLQSVSSSPTRSEAVGCMA